MLLLCDAILFDMDGTLVDSTVVVERQWRQWAERHGLDPAPILAVAHGRRTIDTIRDIAPQYATEEEAVQFDINEAADRDGVVPVPGAGSVLAAMNGHPWAVVTSASRLLASTRLEAAGLPLPPVLIGSDDVRQGKPEPEGYLRAARSLAVEPTRCVVFEDTPAGIAAGKAAGMPVIALTTTYPQHKLLGATAHIPDLNAITVEPAHEARFALRLRS